MRIIPEVLPEEYLPGIVLANNTLVWGGGKNGLFGASASALNAGGNVMWAWQVFSSGDDKPSENMNGSPAVDEAGTIYGQLRLQEWEVAHLLWEVMEWRSGVLLWAMSARWIKAVL